MKINFHPHLHFLVTEGGVDEAGVFHKVPRIDDSRLGRRGHIGGHFGRGQNDQEALNSGARFGLVRRFATPQIALTECCSWPKKFEAPYNIVSTPMTAAIRPVADL